MEIPRKNQEEMLEFKIPIEMQNAFNGLISRLDNKLRKESVNRENMLTEISKTKAKRKKMEKS